MCFILITLIITFIYSGGATVFPWLGAKVEAKKGRALLWYNMLPNGQKDGRLEHGACPVFIGDKWSKTNRFSLK